MRDVTVVEVGPRDGLQNEPAPVATGAKIRLVDALSAAGLPRIEATSFVSPKWVPQLADGAAVMAGIARAPGIRYAALVPNMKGYEAARAAGVDEIAVFAAASETFSRRNINATIAESLARFAPVAEAARADGLPMRAYVSCAVVCPYEGAIAPDAVADLTGRLLALGAYEVSLGDTVGRGTPETVAAMLDAVLAVAPADRLAGHYHDTNGRALESVAVSLEKGVRVFDAAVAGLGGCPYAPGATGNLATERLVDWLEGRGLATGVDRAALEVAARIARGLREDAHA